VIKALIVDDVSRDPAVLVDLPTVPRAGDRLDNSDGTHLGIVVSVHLIINSPVPVVRYLSGP
jgi:hypothetical protein